MRKKAKIIIVVAVLAVCFALAASLHVYYLTDSSGGTLFWRGNEAYLFLEVSHVGYRFSYLEFPFVVIGEHFYWVPYTKDRRDSSMVIRITPSSVERHFVDYGYGWNTPSPDFLTPFDDGFYAHCQGAILCKWTNNGFVPATQEEARRIGGETALVRGDMNNQIVNGWHVRETGRLESLGHFELPVGKRLTISMDVRLAGVRSEQTFARWVTIELLRTNQPPQSLYDVNGAQQRVSRGEYEKVFPHR